MNQIELFSVLKVAEFIGKEPDQTIVSSIENDHRLIKKDACFIAIKGINFDGHSVLQDAINRGAKILIVEEVPSNIDSKEVVLVKVDSTIRAQALLINHYLDQPSTKMKLVAVTGTNGKTTTSTLISQLLELLNHTTGLIGTIEYKIADKTIEAVNTTPDSLRLQNLFDQMVKADCSDAIIEASSHALQLGRLSYTDVDCAIFTNLTREHLDFHKTMENYAFAKSLLFSQLGQRFNTQGSKLSIINLDEEIADMLMQVTSSEIATYSRLDHRATVYSSDISETDQGMMFNLHYQGNKYAVEIPMLGEYNVSNYLAVFLCLTVYYGYSVQTVLDVTKKLEGVPGRMQLIDEGQDYKIIVDFAHTPDALENVLSSVSANKKNRLISLMGHSGGNRDSGMRPELGDILFAHSDIVVLTADNPRNESVEKICKEMLGTHDEKEYHIIENREKAIQTALDMAQPNDVLVFAGKGIEPYQIIGEDEVHVPYNEIEIIENYLRHKKGE